MEQAKIKKVTAGVQNTKFDCGDKYINALIKDSYYPSLLNKVCTYEVEVGSEIIGYCMYCFNEVVVEQFPNDFSDYNLEATGIKKTATVVHIVFLAIDIKYQNRGNGTKLLRVLIKLFDDLAKKYPIQAITLDSKLELVKWYEESGFRVMRTNKKEQAGITEYMYHTCMNVEQIERYTEEFGGGD
ncbi:GNAT family N-acetyltransferase [Clostridiales bacterium COT073_COT-073]|nr:GNAT family N-acetyltransferase [Clostridiales bacterium COT073_COT-073]